MFKIGSRDTISGVIVLRAGLLSHAGAVVDWTKIRTSLLTVSSVLNLMLFLNSWLLGA